MTPVVWVGAVSIALAGALGVRFGHEIWLGMAAPLVVFGVTWIAAVRAYRAAPERLTPVMIAAFAGKLVFFGAYVALAIGVLGANPVPFAVSFTGFFLALHLIEALLLKRLFVS